MDFQPASRPIQFASIVFTVSLIFAFPVSAMAQKRLAGVIAAGNADALSSDELSQTSDDAHSPVDDSGVRTESKSKKSPPPDVHGTWCGPMTDDFFGAGSISIVLDQKGSKLSGTWNTSLVGGGSLKGKVKGSAFTLTLRQQGSHCKALVHGTLVQPGEVTGSYTIFGCQQSDGGTFDVTSPNC